MCTLPALPADYPANMPPESCSDRIRRQAVSELQTKPAVHCTDPAAPGRYPGTRQSSTVPSRRCVLIRTRQANENRGSVWSRCSVCWRVGLLRAFHRNRFASKGKSMCTVNAASVEPAGREEVSGVASLKPWSARACSSESQSVAQIDQRRPTLNPACFEGHV